MPERLTQSSKRSSKGELVTSTPVLRDRRSDRRGSPEVSIGQQRLPDGRYAVRVQGHTVKGQRTAPGESIVAIPKSVFLEGAARIVAQDIVRFTKTARDIVSFTRPAVRRLRSFRKARAAK